LLQQQRIVIAWVMNFSKMPLFLFRPTAKFSVIEIEPPGRNVFDCDPIRLYTKGISIEFLKEKFSSQMTLHGGCILTDIVPYSYLEKARNKFAPLFTRIKSSFDGCSDDFNFSQEYLDKIGQIIIVDTLELGNFNVLYS
jgi:hypothetical protein